MLRANAKFFWFCSTVDILISNASLADQALKPTSVAEGIFTQKGSKFTAADPAADYLAWISAMVRVPLRKHWQTTK